MLHEAVSTISDLFSCIHLGITLGSVFPLVSQPVNASVCLLALVQGWAWLRVALNVKPPNAIPGGNTPYANPIQGEISGQFLLYLTQSTKKNPKKPLTDSLFFCHGNQLMTLGSLLL